MFLFCLDTIILPLEMLFGWFVSPFFRAIDKGEWLEISGEGESGRPSVKNLFFLSGGSIFHFKEVFIDVDVQSQLLDNIGYGRVIIIRWDLLTPMLSNPRSLFRWNNCRPPNRGWRFDLTMSLTRYKIWIWQLI